MRATAAVIQAWIEKNCLPWLWRCCVTAFSAFLQQPKKRWTRRWETGTCCSTSWPSSSGSRLGSASTGSGSSCLSWFRFVEQNFPRSFLASGSVEFVELQLRLLSYLAKTEPSDSSHKRIKDYSQEIMTCYQGLTRSLDAVACWTCR